MEHLGESPIRTGRNQEGGWARPGALRRRACGIAVRPRRCGLGGFLLPLDILHLNHVLPARHFALNARTHLFGCGRRRYTT